MNAMLIYRFSLMVFNTTLPVEVENIFSENVSPDVLKWLIEKAKELRERYDTNAQAWIAFVLDLDEDNLNVLAKHVEAEVHKYHYFS